MVGYRSHMHFMTGEKLSCLDAMRQMHSGSQVPRLTKFKRACVVVIVRADRYEESHLCDRPGKSRAGGLQRPINLQLVKLHFTSYSYSSGESKNEGTSTPQSSMLAQEGAIQRVETSRSRLLRVRDLPHQMLVHSAGHSR